MTLMMPHQVKFIKWIGSSIVLLCVSYWWMRAQLPIDNALSNYDIQLLDQWNRNAA